MGRIHDVGGMQGFPPIEVDPDEPPFRADWEAHVFALAGVLGRQGVFTDDEFRDAIETMPPRDYLAASYYERWLHAITTLLVTKGVLTEDEITGG
jgi:nitrile hydratase